MRHVLLSLVLLVPTLVAGQVYRWVDPDGTIHYSDRPVTGADTLGVPVRKAPHQEMRAPGQAFPGPYAQFEIITPADNETIRDPEGNVQVGLVLEPALMDGHRLQILTDGAPATGEAPGTQLRISGLPLGTHQIQAKVINAEGAPIASSSIVHFHLLKP